MYFSPLGINKCLIGTLFTHSLRVWVHKCRSTNTSLNGMILSSVSQRWSSVTQLSTNLDLENRIIRSFDTSYSILINLIWHWWLNGSQSENFKQNASQILAIWRGTVIWQKFLQRQVDNFTFLGITSLYQHSGNILKHYKAEFSGKKDEKTHANNK